MTILLSVPFCLRPALSKAGLDTRTARRLQAAARTRTSNLTRAQPHQPASLEPQYPRRVSSSSGMRLSTHHLPIARRCGTPEANFALTTIRSLRTPSSQPTPNLRTPIVRNTRPTPTRRTETKLHLSAKRSHQVLRGPLTTRREQGGCGECASTPRSWESSRLSPASRDHKRLGVGSASVSA